MKRCQHCDRNITPHPSGHWLDSDGMWLCMRSSDGSPVPHTPMPVIV